MPPTNDIDDLRQKLTHAEAVIVELRGVVTKLRKQLESQQAHIHRLVKITYGWGGRLDQTRATCVPRIHVPLPNRAKVISCLEPVIDLFG